MTDNRNMKYMTAPSASQKGGMAMDRILTHPILGDTPEGRLVNFTYDGQTLQGIEGEPIAAALRVAGVMTHRQYR